MQRRCLGWRVCETKVTKICHFNEQLVAWWRTNGYVMPLHQGPRYHDHLYLIFTDPRLYVLERTLTPHRHPEQLFRAGLSKSDLDELRVLLTHARHSPSLHALPWSCDGHLMGQLARVHVPQLLQVLQPCQASPTQVLWSPDASSSKERSRALEGALQMLHIQGQLRGWRSERFSFWSHDTMLPQPAQSDFVRVERAGFLYLGMLSHAVHINGFTPDGHLWCGQRSATKSTDPGLWDNLTAGGLPAGETLLQCAERELWEEAGFTLDDSAALQTAGQVRISQMAPGGWHDEVLHVFNLALPDSFVPCNQDGEVQAFERLSAPKLMERINACQFTPDAALAIAQGLLTMD